MGSGALPRRQGAGADGVRHVPLQRAQHERPGHQVGPFSFLITAGMQLCTYVAGYLKEERRRRPVVERFPVANIGASSSSGGPCDVDGGNSVVIGEC